MSNQIDFVPFATATGANVASQGNYQGSSYQQQGFTSGTASSAAINKALRQGTVMAAAWATAISNVLNTAVVDDGNLPELVNNLTNAVNALVTTIKGAAITGSTVDSTPIGSSVPASVAGTYLSTSNTVPGALLGNHSYITWAALNATSQGATGFINCYGTGAGGFEFFAVGGNTPGNLTSANRCAFLSNSGAFTCAALTLTGATTGPGSTLPSTPAGFLTMNINGVVRNIPYY